VGVDYILGLPRWRGGIPRKVSGRDERRHQLAACLKLLFALMLTGGIRCRNRDVVGASTGA